MKVKAKMIEHIVKLVREEFDDWKSLGNVNVKEYGDLLLFNYTPLAQYEGRWNDFEIVSRGLIISKNGEIVARPFDKFFNYGERGIVPKGQIVSVSEKMDGSLGIMYRHNGEYKIATRGSLDSEQALWATDYLKKYDLGGLPNEYTLLFEVIYPDNRVVVDYFGKEDLVLIAVRNRFTGEYLNQKERTDLANMYGFSLPTEYSFGDIASVLSKAKNLSVNEEGFVVEFSNGERWKIKGEEYLKAHKIISNLSFKNTLAYFIDGTLDEMRAIIPDEFLDEVDKWVEEIENTIQDIESRIEDAFLVAPKENRKEFSLWVMENHKSLASYMFARLDKKPIRPLIFKNAFTSTRM